jgi:hypothetical protein
MLPRLEAGERLDGMTVALASGNRMLEDHSRQRYVGQLERQLAGIRKPKRATVESLAGMKVQVVIEKDDDDGGDDVGASRRGSTRPRRRPRAAR